MSYQTAGVANAVKCQAKEYLLVNRVPEGYTSERLFLAGARALASILELPEIRRAIDEEVMKVMARSYPVHEEEN